MSFFEKWKHNTTLFYLGIPAIVAMIITIIAFALLSLSGSGNPLFVCLFIGPFSYLYMVGLGFLYMVGGTWFWLHPSRRTRREKK